MEAIAGGRSYTQTARAKSQERTREALIGAAAEAFFSGRWEHVSLAEMALAAGVTKQTLLRHFGCKQGLLEQMLRHGFDLVRDQRWAAPTDDIAGAVDNLLDHYEQVGERAIVIGNGGGASKAVTELGDSARQLHYDWVQHVFGAWLERLRPKDRARCRAALIALCDVQAWWLWSHELGMPRAEARATLIQAIERLLEEKT
ncbi:MAG: TetR/AcrR family transcriptional regulator [Solirubrobacteraceae bacterium]